MCYSFHQILLLLLLHITTLVTCSEHVIPENFNKYQSPEEAKYLKYHKCKDTGEAYGASYFITREYLLRSGIQKYNLTWVNCEMGSFTFMNQRLNAVSIQKENVSGVVIQSLDVSMHVI